MRTGTTGLRAKVWVTGSAEPTGSSLEAIASTAALQKPGSVIVTEYVSGMSTAHCTVQTGDV